MAKVRITVEVDILDENDIPAIAQMVPGLVQATTRTVHELMASVQNPFAIGECQGQAVIMGNGLEHLPNPEMPLMASDRPRRRIR